jgi:hypothetical protein
MLIFSVSFQFYQMLRRATDKMHVDQLVRQVQCRCFLSIVVAVVIVVTTTPVGDGFGTDPFVTHGNRRTGDWETALRGWDHVVSLMFRH